MRALSRVLRSSSLRGLALVVGLLGILALSACGGAQNLVIVNVAGLVPEIKELYVTMQLDGVPAKNTRPLPESGDSAFVVYDQMHRFGIEVPIGTGTLSLDIKGHSTTRDTVRSGTGSVNLTVARELSIVLSAP
jgi:hypothetical protein